MMRVFRMVHDAVKRLKIKNSCYGPCSSSSVLWRINYVNVSQIGVFSWIRGRLSNYEMSKSKEIPNNFLLVSVVRLNQWSSGILRRLMQDNYLLMKGWRISHRRSHNKRIYDTLGFWRTLPTTSISPFAYFIHVYVHESRHVSRMEQVNPLDIHYPLALMRKGYFAQRLLIWL